MAKTFFVTGTDTEVGKTAVAAGLLRAAAAAGMSTAAVKPVAAGCDEQGCNEDALALQQAMTFDLPYEQINPVALHAAIAPHIAAQQEQRRLRASTLGGYCRGVMMCGADFIVVEGAGGWRVPLNASETLAHLAVDLQAPVILVVAMRLGCINHALLTAEAILRDGLRLAGWVANSVSDAEMGCYSENLATLIDQLPAPLLGEIPYMSTLNIEEIGKILNIQTLT